VRGAPRASGSERLPVDVRLARERLLQRLRGDPVDRNRFHFKLTQYSKNYFYFLHNACYK